MTCINILDQMVCHFQEREPAMRAVAMTTVRFLTQPIQTSSWLLGTLMIDGLEELQDLQEQNLQHGSVQDT